MVLPSGVNKATGLKKALKQMNLDAKNVVAVGDAENDLAFLAACGLGEQDAQPPRYSLHVPPLSIECQTTITRLRLARLAGEQVARNTL